MKRRWLGSWLVVAVVLGTQAASAQGLGSLSCGQLWHERNAIFAQYGFCFKTEQAIRSFGRACFPPYGQLPSGAQARVDAIIAWEQRKGCN